MKPHWLPLIILVALFQSTYARDAAKLTGISPRHKNSHFPLAEARINIELSGPIATTSWTLRYHNKTNNEAEGKLQISLHKDTSVVGYAMDVNGQMREGVVVDANRARRAYEEIVSQRIDPGILEKTSTGFSTRVYPIPANGSKTVRIDMAEFRPKSTWQPHLPSDHAFPADWVILCHDYKAPKCEGLTINWQKENGIWTARGKNTLSELSLLKITPQEKPQRWVATTGDKNIRVVGTFSDKELQQERNKPKHIHLWWDGSLAGRNRDVHAICTSLEALFTWVQNAEITLTIIRNKNTTPVLFKITNGKCIALIDKIRNEPAKGMVRFDALIPNTKQSLNIVISEGLTALPSLQPKLPENTQWCLIDPSGKNGHSLGLYILKSGHELRSPTNLEWSKSITHAPAKIFDENWTVRRQSKNWIISGEITQKKFLSFEDETARSQTARALWAIETHHAMIIEDTPHNETLEFAKHEKVLTDQTSFIVLDRLQDYVNYQIQPPEPELQKLWSEKSAVLKKQNTETLADWTTEWQKWHHSYHQDAPSYANQLAKALGKTSSFWARHIGNGEKQIPAEKMAHLVQLQAKVSNLTEKKETSDTLKTLFATQKEWLTLRSEMAERIGVIRVSVGGFVRLPGRKEFPATTNLAEAIELSGGATPFGSIRRVELYREGKKWSYDIRKDAHRKVILHDNDTVNVPQKKWFGNGGGAPGEAVPFESSSQKDILKGSIKKSEWSTDLPYLKILVNLLDSKKDWLSTYEAQSAVYGWRADYYLDIVDLLENRGLKKEALEVARNIAQLSVDNPELLRRAARSLSRLGDSATAGLLFQRITRIANDEAISWVDMARWHREQKDLEKTITCYAKVTEKTWPKHWHPTWTSAMIELNGLLSQHGKKLAEGKIADVRQMPLTADFRVVLDWDAARSNVNLSIREPLGSIAGWGTPRSDGGGSIPADAIAGYGPEQYLIRKAIPGEYLVNGKFHGDWSHSSKSTVTVEATITLNFGKTNESHKRITLRLPETKRREFGKVRWEIPQP